MGKKSGNFVLIIGDEGGILTYLVGGKVERRFFAPSASYSDSRAMQECLESDPKAPISILVDVMDQSYVQQSLPPVSSLSINNLIKRKMERDFAAEDLKGALQIGREKEGRKDWKYLFVTLSQTPQLQAWIDMVIDLPNPFKGLFLLPVEAENFMHTLRDALSGKKHKKGKPEEGEARWQLLVAHNKVGGFRQVVLKDGKLVFARLAQPIGDSQAEVIAGSIEQEISVTVEYLKRLGYSDEQGSEFYIITSEAIKQSIDPNNLNATQTFVMTPHETSTRLGYEGVTEVNDQFADIVLSVAFAKSKKHALRLNTKQGEQLTKAYATITAVKATAALLGIAALGGIGFYGIKVPGLLGDVSDVEQRISGVERQLRDAKDAQGALPDDLDYKADLVTMHDLLKNIGYSPMEIFHRLKELKQKTKFNFRVNGVSWANDDNLLTKKSDDKKAKDAERSQTLAISIGFDLYETRDGTDEFLKRQLKFESELKETFPDLSIALATDLPARTESTGIDFGAEKPDPLKAREFYSLEYTLSGPVKENEHANKGGRR